jgi:hypothetical protein
MMEVRNTYKILDRKPKGNGPLERRKCRWEDNIKVDLKEIWYVCVDWIHLAKDRNQWRAVVNTAIKFGFYKRRVIF